MPSSSIEIRLVSAANDSARKNRIMKKGPPGMASNSRGIQMKVSPSLVAPTIWLWAAGLIANTVHSTMIPASRETELLPKPIRNELSGTSSRAFM